MSLFSVFALCRFVLLTVELLLSLASFVCPCLLLLLVPIRPTHLSFAPHRAMSKLPKRTKSDTWLPLFMRPMRTMIAFGTALLVSFDIFG